MEIIQASSSCSSIARLPSPRYQLSPISCQLRSRVSPNSIMSVKPKISFGSRFVSATNTRAILENSTSDSVATEVVEVDPLEIKKRASVISSDLKGTSIFLVGIHSSYKSSLGRVLADALRYHYFDRYLSILAFSSKLVVVVLNSVMLTSTRVFPHCSDSLVEEATGGKTSALSYIESDEEAYLASETEVLKQLSSMGRLVVCAGNGAVKSATNLSLLRHGIAIWIDVPLDLVARDIMEDKIQLSASDTSKCRSSSEILAQLTTLYDSARSGYSTADATISLQKVAAQLGYEELDVVTTEDLCVEVLKEIEKLMRVKKMMEEAARPF
ncbi:hypothetical protein ACJIZ3_018249 [Penstemon smallii]|uniref:Inactive shikimate kinase like 1, chloroplastic n=1 Tax=Penstemon smallii TaxID=265156 RepID=A0ABD3SZ78_9LAMI